jgi:predicted N-formylglutamate amidohydrolase
MPTPVHENYSLLAPDEPAAFRVERRLGRSPIFLICDHAGARVPRRLNALGLAAEDLQRHIALDIGIAEVALKLAARLDAFLILQPYSRLVVDCNRPLGSQQSIVAVSDGTRIPGNEQLSAVQVRAREREIFQPYHGRISAELDLRQAQQRPTVLVAMHSFTPTMQEQARPWHAGLLYNRDPRLAQALLRILGSEPGFLIGDNQPYAASDSTDYAIPVYGEQRGLLHVGIELRQDLIAEEARQDEWAERLARALPLAVAESAH